MLLDPPFVAGPLTVHTAEPCLPYLPAPGRWDVADLGNMQPGETLESFVVRCHAAARFWFDQDRAMGLTTSPAPAPVRKRGRARSLPPAPPAAEVKPLPGETLDEFKARRNRLAVQRHRQKRALTSAEVSASTPSEGQPSDVSDVTGGKSRNNLQDVNDVTGRNINVSAHIHAGAGGSERFHGKTSEDRGFLDSGAGGNAGAYPKTSEDQRFSKPLKTGEDPPADLSAVLKTSEDRGFSTAAAFNLTSWIATPELVSGLEPELRHDWVKRVIEDVADFALHEGYSPAHVERILLHIFREQQ